MNVRNEIKAQIIRAGFTMQEVVDLLHDEYDWSDSVSNPICPPNCNGRASAIRKLWNLPMCWAMRLYGRSGVNANGKGTIRHSPLCKVQGA